jgi:hypothetical protein
MLSTGYSCVCACRYGSIHCSTAYFSACESHADASESRHVGAVLKFIIARPVENTDLLFVREAHTHS